MEDTDIFISTEYVLYTLFNISQYHESIDMSPKIKLETWYTILDESIEVVALKVPPNVAIKKKIHSSTNTKSQIPKSHQFSHLNRKVISK